MRISRRSVMRPFAFCWRLPRKETKSTSACCAFDSVHLSSRPMPRGLRQSRDATRFSRHQHRGAAQLPATQCLQRFVRVLQSENLRLRANRNPCGQREKFFTIAAGEVRHRTDAALVPKIAVRKRGNIAHVDPAADHRAAAFHSSQGRGNQLADWRKNDGGVEFFRRRLIRSARPTCAQIARKFLAGGAPGPGYSEDFAVLMTRHLRNQVCRHAESVKTEPSRI